VCHVLAYPFHVGGFRNLWGPILATRLARQVARQLRNHAMAGPITPIHCCEEPLSIQENWATYHSCTSRVLCWRNASSIAFPAECILGGGQAIGTYPGSHWATRCRATGHQSPCNSFALDRKSSIMTLFKKRSAGKGGARTKRVAPNLRLTTALP
jgi:hypothetical protein